MGELTDRVGPMIERGVATDAILAAVVDFARLGLGAERGTLFIWDRARDELFSRVADLPELEEIRAPSRRGLAGAALHGAALVHVDDAYTDPRFNPEVDRRTGYRTRSVLAAPIRGAGGEPVGVLQLIHGEAGRFDAAAARWLEALGPEVYALLEASSLFGEVEATQTPSSWFNDVIGVSPQMSEVFRWVKRAAPRSIPILLQGETGTGKGLIARTVHLNSRRQDGPWVVLDCTTLTSSLAESELFGHTRGAFTGALADHRGAFERANGGTLFIDEIGDLPAPLQGKLLRAVQDGCVLPVGATRPVCVDVRIIAATHRDLREEVAHGRFREDLYYRLAVLTLTLPPLRARGPEDIDRLAEHALRAIAAREDEPRKSLSPGARRLMRDYEWPGNVRELRNVLERAVLGTDGDTIDAEGLALGGRAVSPQVGCERLEEVERAHIRAVLARCDGNQSEAARRLGIARNTLRARLATSPLRSDRHR